MSRGVIDIILNFSGSVVVFGQVILVSLILLYLLSKLNKKSKQLKSFFGFVSQNAIPFAFLVSALATVGSLFLSEVAKIPPCNLCWYQRIFMFPQVFILGIALLTNDRRVKKYIVPLGVVGSFIAVYQYLLQWVPALPLPCTNEVVSCTAKQIELFGYLTIPLMSLTAFALILYFMLILRER